MAVTPISIDPTSGRHRSALDAANSERSFTRRRHGVRAWLGRYGPSELAGTVAALVVLMAVEEATGSTAIAAYAGAGAEGLVYYGIIFLRALAVQRRKGGCSSGSVVRDSLLVLHRMLIEFGGAEAIDLLVVGPICLAVGARLGGPLGALAGKLVADVAFYGPVLATHEWSATVTTRCSDAHSAGSQ